MSEDWGIGLAKAIPAVMDYVADPIPEPECRSRGFGGPAVFCFSGCRDDQTSLDLTVGGKSCGALTSCYMKTLQAGGNSSDYETVFRSACANMDVMRKSMSGLVQAPQLTYSDSASPSTVKFHQQPRGSGGFQQAYPSPGHGQPPRKDSKKDKKDKGDKKEKKAKEPKQKKEKGKKGKSKDLGDSDSDSESEHQRKADAGRHVLAAAFGRF